MSQDTLHLKHRISIKLLQVFGFHTISSSLPVEARFKKTSPDAGRHVYTVPVGVGTDRGCERGGRRHAPVRGVFQIFLYDSIIGLGWQFHPNQKRIQKCRFYSSIYSTGILFKHIIHYLFPFIKIIFGWA